MEAWLKEKENEHDTKIAQEEEGSKHSTSYIKNKRTITKWWPRRPHQTTMTKP